MLKALQLIFSPTTAWARIAEAQRGVIAVFLLNSLPLMLCGAALEGWGLRKFGVFSGELDRLKPVPLTLDRVLRFEGLHLAMNVILLLLTAKLMEWMFESFHSRSQFQPAFATMAYSLGPFFVFNGLDGLPMLNTWVCFTLGVLLSLHVLYYGVGVVMQPDQTKGFGLFVSSGLAMGILAGLALFLEVSALHGKIFAKLLEPH